MKPVPVVANPYIVHQVRFCLIPEEEKREKAREEASCAVKPYLASAKTLKLISNLKFTPQRNKISFNLWVTTSHILSPLLANQKNSTVATSIGSGRHLCCNNKRPKKRWRGRGSEGSSLLRRILEIAIFSLRHLTCLI